MKYFYSDQHSPTMPLDKSDEGSGEVTLGTDPEHPKVYTTDEVVDKASTRKEDVPIDVNKRQVVENSDEQTKNWTKKLVCYSYMERFFIYFLNYIVSYCYTQINNY